MTGKLVKVTFDTRCSNVLDAALSDGLFAARGIDLVEDKASFEQDGGQTTCSVLLRSQSGALGAVNILWEDFWGPFPYSIFAYSGRECELKEGVSFDDLCAKCFQVNQDTPLSNVNFRIDEPVSFSKKQGGNIVCIAGLPLLPFEVEANYQQGQIALETLLVGAMESAFAGEALIETMFDGYIAESG